MGNQPTEEDLLVPFEQRMLRGQYKEYFTTKKNNFFATIQGFPDLWQCFALLDEIRAREFSDLERLRDPNQMLPAVLFLNAHAQFRIAFELGLSCCISEAWNVLRSGIESVAHAHKVLREPHLARVWAEKNDRPTQAKTFKKAFQENKKESLFPSQHGLDELHKHWAEFSEWGTHTSVNSLARRVVSQETTSDVNWRLIYIKADPARLATPPSIFLHEHKRMPRYRRFYFHMRCVTYVLPLRFSRVWLIAVTY